jgi:hypothetical protein
MVAPHNFSIIIAVFSFTYQNVSHAPTRKHHIMVTFTGHKQNFSTWYGPSFMSPLGHLTFGSGSYILGKSVNSGLVFQQYDSLPKCSVHFFVFMYVWALDKRQSPIASSPQLNTMCKKKLHLHKFCSTGQQNRKQHLRE